MSSPKEHDEKVNYTQHPDQASSSESIEVKGDYGSRSDHPFTDEVSVNYWRNVYEKAQYEGRHRFDPTFQWSATEEKKLLRKIDLRIMFWAWIMFLSLDFNRRNINRAVADNLLEELKMNTNHFNYGNTIFLASFLAAELPSGLISKKVGPDRWIPFIIVSWSAVSASQAAMKTRTAYYVCRCLLGLLMGGFTKDDGAYTLQTPTRHGHVTQIYVHCYANLDTKQLT